MEYTINSIYNSFYQKVHDVYSIFQDFFGPEYVDIHKPNNGPARKRSIAFSLLSKGIEGIDPTNVENTDYDRPLTGVTDAMVNALRARLCPQQDCCLFVWWPRVTVTNEHNKSIVIYDLYAKILLQMDGTIDNSQSGFTLNRATYPIQQFQSNYLHSHIHSIPKHRFSEFDNPCLGSGPIRYTIQSLSNICDEALWMLFCQELDMFVSVESLEGGPWRRLESVTDGSQLHDYSQYNLKAWSLQSFSSCFDNNVLRSFLDFYLRHGHLSLSYIHHKFVCAMPCYKYIIDVSNAFITFYNTHLASKDNKHKVILNGLLCAARFSNNAFYSVTPRTDTSDIAQYVGKYVLTFKGKKICLSIIDDTQDSSSDVTLINYQFAMYVLRTILQTINYRYNNEHNDKSSNGQALPSVPGQRVVYI